MKQIINKGGRILTVDVPAPVCGDNEVLVGNLYSLISAGTETTSIGDKRITKMASMAVNDLDLIKKAMDLVKKEGFKRAIKIIKNQTGELITPLGYSSSGIVLTVGKNINDIAMGDKVACAGAGYANHAEIISVPRNLIVKIPENVDFDEAAFTTVGAIAMQGIRRAEVQLGDNVVVLGLGLLGQIACQILKAAGAHVIGIDMIEDRMDLAMELGADKCFKTDENIFNNIVNHTNGLGADSVIIYAATKSSQPVKQAMDITRKKGKVVVVGDVGMDIDRTPFYEKELDFLISSSYGPGRYDQSYEEKGIDYPLGYIRWTENRNMQEFLSLIYAKKVNVKSLIDHVFTIENANNAYGIFNNKKKPIGVVFKYKKTTEIPSRRKISLKSGINKDSINVALIGSGNYAQAFHLPNLKKIPFYNLKAVVGRNGPNTKRIAEEYGAEYFTTNFNEVIQDEGVDLIMITTRHNLHAPIILESAEHKKDIFVEKPIAMDYEECENIKSAIIENNVNLTVGFNRRFSKFAQKMKKLVVNRENPLMITYRINSAGMKKDHWINDPIEGGGAIIGEGCHFFDFCNWIINREPTRVFAEMISSNNEQVVDNNNIFCTIKYEDGSIANVIYSTLGNESFSKERIEVFYDNGIVLIDDFKEIKISGFNEKGQKINYIEKGQYEIVKEYGEILMGQKHKSEDLPTFEDGIRATYCSLKVLESLKTGKPIEWSY